MGKGVKTHIYPRTIEERTPIYSQNLPLYHSLGDGPKNYKQMVLHTFSVVKILLFTSAAMLENH